MIYSGEYRTSLGDLTGSVTVIGAQFLEIVQCAVSVSAFDSFVVNQSHFISIESTQSQAGIRSTKPNDGAHVVLSNNCFRTLKANYYGVAMYISCTDSTICDIDLNTVCMCSYSTSFTGSRFIYLLDGSHIVTALNSSYNDVTEAENCPGLRVANNGPDPTIIKFSSFTNLIGVGSGLSLSPGGGGTDLNCRVDIYRSEFIKITAPHSVRNTGLCNIVDSFFRQNTGIISNPTSVIGCNIEDPSALVAQSLSGNFEFNGPTSFVQYLSTEGCPAMTRRFSAAPASRMRYILILLSACFVQ